MPEQKPGRSKQDYETPQEFINAVECRWGRLDLDLAGTYDNTKADCWFSPQCDSLAATWAAYENCERLWLNPPFARITPWAKKCATDRLPTQRIFFLTPASVCASWFTDYVLGHARVYLLQPRLSFDGKHPFPKDLILSVYGEPPGFEVWRWRTASVRSSGT